MQSKKSLIVYYVILYVALVFVVNTVAPISTAIRILYLLLLIGPILIYKKIELLAPILICFYVASTYSFGYTLMPSEPGYYLLLSIILPIFLVDRSSAIKPTIIIGFFVVLYVSFIDFLNNDKDLDLVRNIILVIFLSFSINKKNQNEALNYLKVSVIGMSFALAIWFVFSPEARTVVYNTANGLEQLGWQDPNYYGSTMGMGVIVCLIEIFAKKNNRLQTYLFMTIIAIIIIALLMNASRGSILAMLISSAFFVLNLKMKFSRKLLFLFLSLIILYYIYTSDTYELLFTRFSEDDATGSGRTSIWSTKLQWFFGGSFDDILLGKGHSKAVKYGGMGFHNDYLAVLVEYGIIGFILFISALLYPLKISNKLNRIPVVSLLLYFYISCFTIEPVTAGSLAPLAYLFFIIQYSRYSSN